MQTHSGHTYWNSLGVPWYRDDSWRHVSFRLVYRILKKPENSGINHALQNLPKAVGQHDWSKAERSLPSFFGFGWRSQLLLFTAIGSPQRSRCSKSLQGIWCVPRCVSTGRCGSLGLAFMNDCLKRLNEKSLECCTVVGGGRIICECRRKLLSNILSGWWWHSGLSI